MNKLDLDYQNLLKDILENGTTKETRNGGTISVFGRQIRHSMKSGFPILTTKKIHFKSVVSELLWFLQGRTDLRWLLEQGNTIWVGDTYKKYKTSNPDLLANDEMFETKDKPTKTYRFFTQEEFINKIKIDDEFARKWGDLGPIYGRQWRNCGGDNFIYGNFRNGIDQISRLINDLKTNPDSRRLMVSSWNIGELDQMVLPPCHYGFQVYTRELDEKEGIKKNGLTVKYKGNDCKIVSYHNANHELIMLSTPEGDRLIYENQLDEPIDYSKFPTRAISLMWNQRSVDTPLGLPFNIASYALLLEIIAKTVNMIPEELIGNLGDCHIYTNQIDGIKEQLGRELTYNERYDIWFKNNFETGMEYNIDIVPDFNNPYYEPTPKRSREPYPLPKLKHMKTDDFYKSLSEDLSLLEHLEVEDFILENYQSHPAIKMPLSN